MDSHLSLRGLWGVVLAALVTSACSAGQAPAWTPAAAQYNVVWSMSGVTADGGARFPDKAHPRLAPGSAMARVTCDIESTLLVGITRVVPDPVRETVEPLSLSAKVVCSPHSGSRVVALDGQATGLEDLLLVTSRAGATGRDSVAYSIEILQPITD